MQLGLDSTMVVMVGKQVSDLGCEMPFAICWAAWDLEELCTRETSCRIATECHVTTKRQAIASSHTMICHDRILKIQRSIHSFRPNVCTYTSAPLQAFHLPTLPMTAKPHYILNSHRAAISRSGSCGASFGSQPQATSLLQGVVC